ncbi:hypothetical protein [Chryseobacterium indoltheticum]|uniref:hypothetical protein n=1 Tax=Chryseobacterium indoltheticum TaxID=254 RepID=UPI003F49346C
MANNNLNYEDYPAIGDALIASLSNDQSEFLVHYKTMDSDFIIGFQSSIDAVRQASSVLAKTQELKNVTKQLYSLADEANKKLLFLLDYADDSGLETKGISAIRSKFSNRNIEGGIKDLRAILPYLQDHKTELEAGDMPNQFLEYFPGILPTMETLNAEQIRVISARKSLVETNGALFENAYGYISKVSNRGKKVFRKTMKKDDYTISKLLSKVRAETKNKENPDKAKS